MDDIKQKISKLLQMSTENGATEAEAETALRLAHALMEKYRLTELDCACCAAGYGSTGRAPSLWKTTLFVAISELYGTILWTQLGKYPSDFTFVGEKFYVDMSLLMAAYLEGVILRTTKTQHPAARGREQFKLGMASRLAQRIREIGASVSWCDSKDARRKTAVDYCLNAYGVQVSYGRSRTRVSDSYYRGKEAGNSVNLSRQTTGTERRSISYGL